MKCYSIFCGYIILLTEDSCESICTAIPFFHSFARVTSGTPWGHFSKFSTQIHLALKDELIWLFWSKAKLTLTSNLSHSCELNISMMPWSQSLRSWINNEYKCLIIQNDEVIAFWTDMDVTCYLNCNSWNKDTLNVDFKDNKYIYFKLVLDVLIDSQSCLH